MQIIRDISTLRPEPSIATIGFFDGVHTGHRYLIRQVKEIAAAKGLRSALVTFPVHPRKVMNAERKALQVMGIGPSATLADVKSKYKALVKQHHPDANGGDRSTEDRLIEIIKAYNYLKTVVREA